MDRFFKYTKKRFAKQMLKFGEVRVRTLYEYRHYDDEEIKDADEGRSITEDYIGETKNYSPDDEVSKAIGNLLGLSFDKDATIKIGNTRISINNECGNAYLYCLTKSPSKKVMRHFGYDACIEILDHHFFASAIRNKLNRKGLLTRDFNFQHACIYEGRKLKLLNQNINFVNEIDDRGQMNKTFWLKDKRFVHQDEYRIVYPSTIYDDSLKPIIFKVPEIRNVIQGIRL